MSVPRQAVAGPAPSWTKRPAPVRGSGRFVQLGGAPRWAAGATVLVVLAVSGCGNWITAREAGRVGITVDASGAAVVAVMTCEELAPVVQLSEGRSESLEDDEPNVPRGEWRARESFVGVRTFPLTDPGEDWVTERSPGTLEADRLFIVDGGAVGNADASLGGVTFRAADVAALTPDQVRVREGDVEPLSSFGDYECEDF